MRKLVSFAVALVCLAGALVARAEGDASQHAAKSSRTVRGAIPWKPVPPVNQPKVVYGEDDRIDLYQETDPRRRTWAASTCGLFFNSDVTNNGNGTYSLRTSSYNVCPDEPFATQPTSAFCSGFMVGEDIIATAGHCFDSGDVNSVRFVFGFVMQDATTPVVTVDESHVYTGVELLGRALSGGFDYAVVRVDRAIAAPGAEPFELRRDGVIGIGENVGVIGHPSGLPLKLAFGDQTVVRSNSDSAFFVANLDTYGGNSGSPVINPVTGLLEGILVRGETDFVTVDGCLRSNTVSNTGGRGEDVAKSTSFMEFVPEIVSTIRFDREAYTCGGTVMLTVVDSGAAGMGTATVSVTTSGGDEEEYLLTESGSTGTFMGTVALVEQVATPRNGVLEIAADETLHVVYVDGAQMREDTAVIDCDVPRVDNLAVAHADSQAASITFTADEPVSGTVFAGTTCGTVAVESTFTLGMDQTVTVQGLEPATTYFVYVEAQDSAGNTVLADNGGACVSFTTTESTDYLTERFTALEPDVANATLTFTPAGGSYVTCRETIEVLPLDVTGATRLSLTDDDSELVSLADGARIPFYGVEYSAFYVNSNGNVTFLAGDTNYQPEFAIHFSVPRIAALFTDLNPSGGGNVYVQQRADRMVVTWLDVPHYDFNGDNQIQLEMHFDGTIRISLLGLRASPSLVGLSNGLGLQSDFTASDLSLSGRCTGMVEDPHSADTNRDGVIQLQELMRVIQFVNLGGYHCDAAGEDGYGAGPRTDQACTPHHSDYNGQDWIVSLTEILRLVQFYNAGGYEAADGTEDGFQAVMAP